MKMFRLAPSAAALGALLALTSIIPAQAAPVQTARPPAVSNVKMMQYKPHAGSWHGYRGFRTERPGTRRHSDGYWYPLAAFGVETDTTGSIARQPVNRPAAPAMCNPTFTGSIGPGSMPCDNGY
ncbi:cell surface protein [Rhizobium leguminosarum]|uniref:cell surface protein n=1 Tax=Rhizobium leguminosarum TaxID=384 RepID=UPI001A933D62|nr:cell surface protein [Rhizobium leguminosarum]MBY5557283.1 cell surface protein [Rhizobium leguminosarum]MBY5639720.1 cell surface protein [Rhizobium leguminosarum]MBY5692874.1 cell surface protein [Rhizobium leguminosarum]MBY5728399.1 cell surface protein [Rhizobium leguminosarum]MBY5748496.1 cell surface protein [Rhizobium leguminosarum]